MKADEALRKGEIRDIRIEKIVVGGEGLGYCDGVAVFVPMSVPGDLLQIRIISAKKNYARGLITQILTPGPERVPDTGKISFEDWQGCNFAMLRYDAQLKYKKEIVAEVLRKIGKMEEIPVEEVAPSPEIYHYRNKIIEPFSRRKGEIITGFYARHSHEVFEVRENMLNSRLGNKIIRELKRLLNENRLPVYDENFHSGLLRHVMVRTNSAGEAMVLLVLNAARRDLESERILLALKELIPEIRSLYVSLNPERTNVALGKENRLLWGKETLREEIEGISFHISPLSFFQINFGQAKNLYKKALGLFSDIRGKTVVDGYSGTGTLALLLSGTARKVIAIETESEAVADGIRTAEENGIKNIDFICGNVEEKLPELVKQGEKIDGILFDPPRKGIEREALLMLGREKIPEIVYISCDPATFARDAGVLFSVGYRTDRVFPFDMFPNTAHVECVARFYKTDEKEQKLNTGVEAS